MCHGQVVDPSAVAHFMMQDMTKLDTLTAELPYSDRNLVEPGMAEPGMALSLSITAS